jgi:hypothetical protein
MRRITETADAVPLVEAPVGPREEEVYSLAAGK